MNITRAKAIVLVGFGFLGGMIPRAAADESDQKTIFTFSGMVEIPGQVLEAGTYVLKLADSESDRNIVQVFNKDETHLYATVLSIQDERLRPAGKTIITFDVASFGEADPMYGENLHVAVILLPGMEGTEGELRDYCRTKLSAFEVPEQIHIVADFPHTAKGSTDGHPLAAQFAAASRSHRERA